MTTIHPKRPDPDPDPDPPPPPVPSPTFSISVLPASNLLDPSRKQILRNVCRLINDSFSAHGLPNDNGDTAPDALFLRKRLIHDEELPTELGPDALIAICVDESVSIPAPAPTPVSNSDDDNSKTDSKRPETHSQSQVVATASAKLWKGKVVDLARSIQDAARIKSQSQSKATQVVTVTNGLSDQDLAQAEQTLVTTDSSTTSKNPHSRNQWELKLCASLDDPSYRRQGLLTRCITALITTLQSQYSTTAFPSSSFTNNPANSLSPPLPLKFYITALEGTGNIEYWLRRGFSKIGEAEIAPAGTWESTREIRICTLAKTVE